MPKISIIVPIYNSEKYLKKCIESIQKQTLDDIEIILVNDGSIDSSLSICKALAEGDKRIKVVNQSNGGVSCARNNGLLHATGKYIGFVDSDDWIDKNMYLKMFEAIEKHSCDLVTCNRIYSDNDKGWHLPFSEDSYLNFNQLKDEYIKPMLTRNMAGFVTSNIFKKSLIEQNKIKFKDVSFMEDLMFNLEYISFCQNAYVIVDDLYIYRKRIESLISKFSMENFDSANILINIKKGVYKKFFSDDLELFEKMEKYYLHNIELELKKINLLNVNDEKKIKCLQKIKNEMYLVQYASYENFKFITCLKNENYKEIIRLSRYFCFIIKMKKLIKRIHSNISKSSIWQ